MDNKIRLQMFFQFLKMLKCKVSFLEFHVFTVHPKLLLSAWLTVKGTVYLQELMFAQCQIWSGHMATVFVLFAVSS
jgi:hypothetical protein